MKLTNTIVVAAPACCGKTFAANNSEYDVLDVEEEMASFDKKKSGAFTNMYLHKIKSAVGKKDIIFVAIRPSVMLGMKAMHIKYVLAIPENTDECRAEWLDRSRQRGDKLSPAMFPCNKDIFINLRNDKYAAAKFEIKAGQYLSDIIGEIVSSQNK